MKPSLGEGRRIEVPGGFFASSLDEIIHDWTVSVAMSTPYRPAGTLGDVLTERDVPHGSNAQGRRIES